MSVRVSAVKKQDFRKNCQREKEKNLGTAGLQVYFFKFSIFSTILSLSGRSHTIKSWVLTPSDFTRHQNISLQLHFFCPSVSFRGALTKWSPALSLIHIPPHTICLCIPPAMSICVFCLSMPFFFHPYPLSLLSHQISVCPSTHATRLPTIPPIAFHSHLFLLLFLLVTFTPGPSVRLACLTGCEVAA